ncbi:hypothetical protein [Streptomyces venezuelae]|uniref:hypothetical protein n=1 Tax=Streptomyces venezuelae TaxID=54571 RepID=UPI0016811AA9|nr:hypothetical protein [Streptomyces venezuelae]
MSEAAQRGLDSGAGVRRGEVEGAWQDSSDGSLTLQGDGRFVAADLRVDSQEKTAEGYALVDGAGEWLFIDKTSQPTILLTFSDGRTETVFVRKKDDGAVLVSFTDGERPEVYSRARSAN